MRRFVRRAQSEGQPLVREPDETGGGALRDPWRSEETCTGDPARRLGNEYLYATVAGANIETLNRYRLRRIVTQCPRCYHNLRNEYPDFGLENVEVNQRR